MSEEPRAATPTVVTVREKTSLLRHYLWKYRKMVFLGLCTLLLVDLLELVSPYILKKAVDGVVEQKPYSDLIQFAAMYLAVLLIQGVGRWGWRIFLIRSSMLAGRDLREKFGGHLFGLPATYYDKNRVGDLMSHANSDVEAVRQFLGPGFLTFADALFYVLTVPIAMYMLSPKLTLLALLPLPLIPFFVLKFQNQIHARFKASQDHFSKISAMAQENLNGIRVTKAFAKEDVQLSRFKALGREYIHLNLSLARIQSSFGPLMDFIASLGIVLLIWFGGGWVIDDAVSLGTFVAFQRYIQKMVWPMMAVGLSVSFYQRAIASSDRLKAILATESNIVETAEPKTPMAAGQARTPGRIEIRNLTFSFPESGMKEPVLKNLSLTVESGERVAFVGGIGSGKSALLSLLPRLYPAPKGTIFIDGVAIEDWELSRLRSQIGYVSQEVFLFSENVFDNVAFGLIDEKYGIVKSRVMGAVELATVKNDIENLPKGFDTQLGERGVNLSGGQKQRVTLARAIAKEPSILILDDALSAVDVKTENAILSALRSRPGKNTEIIAAHRISTIRDADRIFVLHQGEIVDQGTHRELVAKKSGIYHQFYEQQRLKEDLERYMERVDEKLDEAGVVPS